MGGSVSTRRYSEKTKSFYVYNITDLFFRLEKGWKLYHCLPAKLINNSESTKFARTPKLWDLGTLTILTLLLTNNCSIDEELLHGSPP